MPFQFVNERKIEAIVGTQMKTMHGRSVGMPTISAEGQTCPARR